MKWERTGEKEGEEDEGEEKQTRVRERREKKKNKHNLVISLLKIGNEFAKAKNVIHFCKNVKPIIFFLCKLAIQN